MSRTEIQAARLALRASMRRHQRWDSAAHTTTASPEAPEFVSACIERLRTEPESRGRLVRELQTCVHAGTYRRPANEIVDQLLGRLTAAALRV